MSRFLLIAIFLTCASSSALGQDFFSLFHEGSETKTKAGAGVMAARNAPANYYNPANLIEDKIGLTPYVALDFLSFRYSYELPGYDPVEIRTSSPVPFFGIAWRSESDLSLAFSFLPVPAGSGERKIETLPTRKFSSDSESTPVLLDVTTKGEGLGLRGSFGAAYKVMSGLGLGVSMLYSRSGGSTTAKAHDNDENLIIDKTETTSYAFILGLRASAMRGSLNSGFTIRFPAFSNTKGSTRYPALAGDEEAPKKSSGKGPLGIGFGADLVLFEGFTPFGEVHYTNWNSLRSEKQEQVLEQAEVDYFSTTDLIFGTDYRLSDYRISLAYGIYQSNIGDGVMKNEADDGLEVIGMEFQNVTGIAHNDLAAGFEFPFKDGNIQTGFLYVSGRRQVGNQSRGYGSYELEIFSLTASCTYHL